VRSHQPGLATIRLNGEHGDGGQTLAVLADGFVLPLAEAARRCGVAGAPPDSLRQALPDWDRWCGVVRQVTVGGGPGEGEMADSGWQDETEVTFLPSLTDPPTVYCAAANYHDHLREMRGDDARAGQSPMYFVAPPASLGGHRQEVVRPAGCERLDWEVELAVVIGRDAKDVAAADADRVIAGYSVANDVSLRDFARRADYPFFPDWLRSKSYAGCLPLGPAVVPASLVPDPMNLALSLTVNGARRQASSSKNMIFSIAEQIEYLSHIVPLRPGDVILTGTPAGTASAWGSYLSPGDVMVAEIECLGRLETQVRASADTLPGQRGKGK
jgi:2-keto-4-pentenoate hydratase/2-oxohepta-3-ene-1,7-dioic acid hydratase in catechol pathway